MATGVMIAILGAVVAVLGNPGPACRSE